MSIAGRTVLVTGASSGIGLATAKLMAERGARVVAAARRLDRLEALAAESEGRIFPLRLDLASRDTIAPAIAALPADWADIEVLVNNAGIKVGENPLQSSPFEEWSPMVETNLLGTLAVTHAVLPRLIASGRGHIVNIGSNSVRSPRRASAVYTATKAALESLSTDLRLDLRGTMVRVTHINVGRTKSNINTERFAGDEAKLAAHYKQPFLEPGAVAESILWAISMPQEVEIVDLRILPTGQASAST